MFEDAQRTLEYQFSTSEGLDDKAAQVFRFSVLIAGLVSTGASVVVSTDPIQDALPGWIVWLASIGLGLLVLSAVLALLAYRATELSVGLEAESIQEAVDDDDLDGETFHRDALIAYSEGIVDNSQSLYDTNRFLNPATWLLLAGVILLAVAAIGLLIAAAQGSAPQGTV